MIRTRPESSFPKIHNYNDALDNAKKVEKAIAEWNDTTLVLELEKVLGKGLPYCEEDVYWNYD